MIFATNRSNPTKARYLRGIAGVMLSYMGLVEVSRMSVHYRHPLGWHLYLAGALPTIPLLCLAWIVGRYLHEERDEYQRDVVVRSILWGAAIVVSLTVLTSFLRVYGWTGNLPPFTEVILFWVVAAIVKIYYRIADRGSDD